MLHTFSRPATDTRLIKIKQEEIRRRATFTYRRWEGCQEHFCRQTGIRLSGISKAPERFLTPVLCYKRGKAATGGKIAPIPVFRGDI